MKAGRALRIIAAAGLLAVSTVCAFMYVVVLFVVKPTHIISCCTNEEYSSSTIMRTGVHVITMHALTHMLQSCRWS
jgi:hypothetical protein